MEQAPLPAAMDEEWLKRQCRDLGLHDAPIFDPANYNGPIDPVTATVMQFGARLAADVLMLEVEQILSKTAVKRAPADTSEPKRGRGRPALRRKAEPPTSAGFGIIGLPRELSVGERRLAYTEMLEAVADRPVSTAELVRFLAGRPGRVPEKGEPAWVSDVRTLFCGAAHQSIEQSISEARGKRSRRSD